MHKIIKMHRIIKMKEFNENALCGVRGLKWYHHDILVG